MKRTTSLATSFGLIALVGVLGFLVGRCGHCKPKPHTVDSHAWIHSQLELTAEQDRQLEGSEQRFTERKKFYRDAIRRGNDELAKAILSDKQYSVNVTHAVEKIHEAQGGLQKATLEHIFEMKQALSPEQYDKLLRLTAKALDRHDHER